MQRGGEMIVSKRTQVDTASTIRVLYFIRARFISNKTWSMLANASMVGISNSGYCGWNNRGHHKDLEAQRRLVRL